MLCCSPLITQCPSVIATVNTGVESLIVIVQTIVGCVGEVEEGDTVVPEGAVFRGEDEVLRRVQGVVPGHAGRLPVLARKRRGLPAQ